MKSKQTDIELENLNNASPTPVNQNLIKTADALFVAAFVGRFVANTKSKQETNKNKIISNDHVEIDTKSIEPESEQNLSKSNTDEKKKRDGASSKTNFGTSNNNAAKQLDQSYQLAFTNKSKSAKRMLRIYIIYFILNSNTNSFE